MRNTSKLLIAFVALTLAAGGLMAQTTRGDIQGKVVGDDGLALPGVTVTIESPDMIGTKTTVTDANGGFKFLVIPPGTYKATFSLSGFQTQEQGGIVVPIGSTARVDATMSAAFTDEVVVTSELPLVDTTSTTVGVNVSSDFFTDLPVGRNYTDVAALTPGAQTDDSGVDGRDDGQTFYGSTGSENAYYIDGANTTGVELGQQGKTLNFEFIDEVQVKTGSYSAEYGRATGGVINVITKSGGNEFHGDVFGYYDSDSLQSDLSAEAAAGAEGSSFTRPGYTRKDYGVDLGGYIAKDKLWFFVAYDKVDNSSTIASTQDFSSIIDGAPFAGQEFDRQTDRDLWAAKLTWRINDNHSLSFSGFGDPTDQTGVLPDSADFTLAGPPQEYIGDITTGGTDYSFNYDGVFGQNWVVSARAAQHNEENKRSGAGTGSPGLLDQTRTPTVAGWDGAPSGDSGFWFYQDQEFGRDQYNLDVSYFLSNFGGSHEFKAGYEYEKISVKNANWNGGTGQRIYRYTCVDSDTRDCQGSPYYYNHRIYLNSPDLDPTQLTPGDINAPLTVDTKADNYAYYLQDSWQILDNLSASLGVRIGEQKLYNGDGGVSADINDNVAPRIGLVWDFMGDGRSKAFAHYGKFYETIPMDIVIRSFGGEISIFSYNLSEDPNEVANDPTVRPARILGGGFSNVDPGVKGQYIEEWVLGAEYEIMQDWAVGIKYIKRDLGRIIEDALTADGDYYIGNPSEGLMEGTYDIGAAYGLNSVLHLLPKPTRKFEGLELTLTKRFSNNFQFIASALFSTLEGNYDGTFQASTGQLDPNLNSAFDYYDFSVHNTGKLSNDRRQQYKFDGIYRFDFGLTAGLSAYWRDGTPITAMGFSVPYNNYEYYLSERGAFGRVDSQYEADIHLGYPLKLPGDLELNFLVDIFNVLDRQGETRRSQRYTTRDWESSDLVTEYGLTYNVIDWATGTPLPAITPAEARGNPANGDRVLQNPEEFNKATRWQDPRTIRLGLRLSF